MDTKRTGSGSGQAAHAAAVNGRTFSLAKAWGYIRRGILFYWYTGERNIAVTSASVTALLYVLLLCTMGATNLLTLVLLLIMDHLLLIFLVLYIVFVRSLVPGVLSSQMDAFMLQYSLPILVGWVGSRVITNLVASRLFGYKL